MGITQNDNLFGLFEKCGSLEKHIEGRVVLADVLAKFERFDNFTARFIVFIGNYVNHACLKTKFLTNGKIF